MLLVDDPHGAHALHDAEMRELRARNAELRAQLTVVQGELNAVHHTHAVEKQGHDRHVESLQQVCACRITAAARELHTHEHKESIVSIRSFLSSSFRALRLLFVVVVVVVVVFFRHVRSPANALTKRPLTTALDPAFVLRALPAALGRRSARQVGPRNEPDAGLGAQGAWAVAARLLRTRPCSRISSWSARRATAVVSWMAWRP